MTVVLVTGTGAIIGYGLLRSIRRSRPEVRLISTDIYSDSVGQTWSDSFEQAPYTTNPNYLTWLKNVVVKHGVNLIIPGIEQDVHFFADNYDAIKELGCKVVLNNPHLIHLTRDKWEMHQKLLELKEPSVIPSRLSGSYEGLVELFGLPFILKPRKSYASKGIVHVDCKEDFDAHKDRMGEILMAQPIVGSDDEEYTVAVFGDGEGNVCAKIALKRRLAQDGSTSKAWVRNLPCLDEVVLRLCQHLKPLGPTNLQFRRDGSVWKLLEINPRISSASSIRRSFGYDEAEMCLDYFLEGNLPEQPRVRDGFAVRFIEEHIVYDRDNF